MHLNALSLHFYWPKMRTDVESYVKNCDACQRAKNSQHKPYGLIQPLEPPKHCWESVSSHIYPKLHENTLRYSLW
jgi:hypothetical protein